LSQVEIRGTKRATRRRVVPLVTEWQRALLRYTLHYAQGEGELLLTTGRKIQEYLPTACKKAKIPRACLNDLRRTCATWLRAEGAPPHLIAPVLGHRDSTMVERVYGRLQPADLAARLRTSLGIASEDDCTKCVSDPKDPAAQMGQIGRLE